MNFVLLDTNVILDYAEEREGFYEAAKEIFETIKRRELVGCVSASAITDIFYFLQKYCNDSGIALTLLKKLIQFLEIIAVDRRTIDAAIASGMSDFEDAVQAAAAMHNGIDMIITRDGAGFRNSGLRVYTPEEFLDSLHYQT